MVRAVRRRRYESFSDGSTDSSHTTRISFLVVKLFPSKDKNPTYNLWLGLSQNNKPFCSEYQQIGKFSSWQLKNWKEDWKFEFISIIKFDKMNNFSLEICRILFSRKLNEIHIETVNAIHLKYSLKFYFSSIFHYQKIFTYFSHIFKYLFSTEWIKNIIKLLQKPL